MNKVIGVSNGLQKSFEIVIQALYASILNKKLKMISRKFKNCTIVHLFFSRFSALTYQYLRYKQTTFLKEVNLITVMVSNSLPAYFYA